MPKQDMAKDGWVLTKDAKFFPVNPFKLELVSFLEPGEPYINGEKMVKRAQKLYADLGQCHAEYLLERQQYIPKDFREYCLVFPGTIWHIPNRGRHIACLCWNREQWFLRFYWFWLRWNSDSRLLRPIK